MVRRKPGYRPKPPELAYRRGKALEYWNAGHTAAQIASAMNPAISAYLVLQDLRVMGVPSGHRRHKSTAAGEPATVDWRNPPATALSAGPADQIALTLRTFTGAMRRLRYESAHASDMAERRLVNDQVWEANWLELIAEASEILATLSEQHDDATGAKIRTGMHRWAAETAQVPLTSLASRARPHATIPDALRAEIRNLLDVGQATNRTEMARRFAVTENIVRWAHQLETARHEVMAELLAAGWAPPAGLDAR
jgi:hypothetical protein